MAGFPPHVRERRSLRLQDFAQPHNYLRKVSRRRKSRAVTGFPGAPRDDREMLCDRGGVAKAPLPKFRPSASVLLRTYVPLFSQTVARPAQPRRRHSRRSRARDAASPPPPGADPPQAPARFRGRSPDPLPLPRALEFSARSARERSLAPGRLALPAPGRLALPGPGRLAVPAPGRVALPGPGRLAVPGPCRYAVTAGRPTPITFRRRDRAVNANSFMDWLE